jgi:sporulation protein YlmC with PRC-barrel domain
MRTTYDHINGLTVIDSTGRVIGEVDGLVFDTASWHVESVRIKLHKDTAEQLGMSPGPFRAARLDVPADFVRDVTDTLVLKGPASALRTTGSRPEPSPPASSAGSSTADRAAPPSA